MLAYLKRVLDDFRRGRNLDLYAASAVAFILAGMTLIGADLPDDVRWSVLLAALGVLVLRLATARPQAPQEMFLDRTAFTTNPVLDRLVTAKEVWIFAPTAANLLTDERCAMLRQGPLSRPGGSVRVVVLDDSDPGRLAVVVEQLDWLLDFPVQEVRHALRVTHTRLRTMAGWTVNGTFAYGTVPFSPGFSILAIDPGLADGLVIVEFHGARNDTIASRMHVRLTRQRDLRWYLYWMEQFNAIWSAATPQPAGTGQATDRVQ